MPPVLLVLLLAAAPLLPPLEGPLTLTSTFGEFRQGHYHGGMDFSTGGQVGLPVLAPGDGWVLRIRASGVGYGRALYLRLDDGRTAVFAHLDRFAAPIEAALRAEQDRVGEYEVDFGLEPGLLSFTRGEPIAFTGETGAGPPHLHAEVRTDASASVAENPLHHGWQVTDATPPSVTRLRVSPSRPGSFVNGGLDPAVVDLAAEPTVRISGGVRLWVETLDRAQPGGTRLGPYRVEAALDDSTFLDIRWDRLDWNHPREVEWTFDAAAARARNERWVALEPPPRGAQAMARGMGTDERTALLAPGPHRLTVTVTDGSGNRTTRHASLVMDPAMLPEPEPGAASGFRVTSLETILEVRGVPGAVETAWTLVAPGGMRLPWTGLAWRFPGQRIGRMGPPQPSESGWWEIVDPGAGGSHGALWIAGRTDAVQLEREGVRASFGSGSVFGPMWVTASWESMPEPPASAPELEPVSRVFSLGPWAHPLRQAVPLVFPVPAGAGDGVALYSRDGNGWSFESAERGPDGIATRITALESLALFRDRTPPVVTLNLGTGRRPEIRARITDGGAGVTWRTLSMEIDGRRVIAEWDPEARTYRAHLREDLAPGTRTVVVRAVDRAGNRSTAEGSLQIE